jgi:hypothetical protein
MAIEERRQVMGVRQKLNQAFFNGSLFLAGVAGVVSESWWFFVVVLLALLALNLGTGEIRPTRRTR